MSAPEISHGRGGAGNIKQNDAQYVDGEVVRAGVEGSHGDGAFSTGRGGAANIADKGVKATERKDRDIVPEAAVRASGENTEYHTGRGGAGNEHVVKKKEDGSPLSLADKLKARLSAIFKK